MPILAVDTSTSVSSVAIADENKLHVELTVNAKLTHSETLMPHIGQAMEMAGIGRKDLTAVAVSIGPGSFTGLRIGLAAAKAMSYALGIPIVGVSTMEAIAWNFTVPKAVVVPLIDAQKGNAYAAAYTFDQDSGRVVPLSDIKVCPFDEVFSRFGSFGATCILAGDMAVKKALPKRDNGELPDGFAIAPMHAVMPRAGSVAAAAMPKLKLGDIDSAMGIEPIYIRRSEAEELWEKRQREMRG